MFFLLLLCGLPKSALPGVCAKQKTTVAAFVVVVVVAVVVVVGDDDVVDGFCFRLLASGSCIQNHCACAAPPLARPCGKLVLPKQHANSLNCLGSIEEKTLPLAMILVVLDTRIPYTCMYACLFVSLPMYGIV